MWLNKKMKKMKKMKIIAIISIISIMLVVLCIALGIHFFVGGTTTTSSIQSVEAQQLSEQDLSNYVSAVGTVESQNVVDVTTDLTVTLKELDVAVGDYVEEGQVLCIFDSSDIQAQIDELEAQISSSDALAAKQLEIAQRNLEEAKSTQTTTLNNDTAAIANAQATVNTAQSAYDSDIAAGSDDDTITSDLETLQEAQETLATAQSTYASDKTTTTEAVESAQDTVDTTSLSSSTDSDTATSLAKLYNQLDEVTIKAPQSGIITSLNISEGGVASGTLMVIQDDSNLQVSVTINEDDILDLSTGLQAIITSDALDDVEIDGTVSRILNFTSSDTSSSSSYSADVLVSETSDLLIGMSVKVKIYINDIGTEQAVAYDSVVEDEDGTYYVYKAVDQGDDTYEITKVIVTVGDKSNYYIAVTSDNLELGDYIISDPSSVTEGEIVTLTDVSDTISNDLSDSDNE